MHVYWHPTCKVSSALNYNTLPKNIVLKKELSKKNRILSRST